MLAFCTAVALVAASLGYVAGLSFEFGAFIAGAVISEAAGSKIVESIVAPFREFFVLVFFVSIGTLVDVRALAAVWPAILLIGFGFAVARWIGWYGLARLVRQPMGTAAGLAIALVPLGEFNVVLANDSRAAGRLDAGEYATVIGVTLLSIALATILARFLTPRLRGLDAARAPGVRPFDADPAVLILGYGRVGRTVGHICKRAGITFAAIEHDVDLVHLAQRDGAQAQYGDAGDPRVVERAITPSVRVIVSTIPDTAINIGLARRLSHQTDARIIARALRVRDVRMVSGAGAHHVLVPEAEGAYRFAESVLIELGLAEDRIAAFVREHRSLLVPP